MTMYAKACAFLRDILAEGPRHSVEVIAAAERAGINYGAVLLAARAVVYGDDLWRLKPSVGPPACGSSIGLLRLEPVRPVRVGVAGPKFARSKTRAREPLA